MVLETQRLFIPGKLPVKVQVEYATTNTPGVLPAILPSFKYMSPRYTNLQRKKLRNWISRIGI